MTAKVVIENLLDLISSRQCIICKKEIESDKEICETCSDIIKGILNNYTPCSRCSLNLKSKNITDKSCYCSKKDFVFENNYSCLPFNQFYHSAFIDAKYHHRYKSADFFIKLAINNFNPDKLNFYKNNIDFIIPVPISYLKKLKRGYSISIKFAHSISKLINKKILHIFYEKGKKYIHLERKNKEFDIKNKFFITKNKTLLKLLWGKNILLIDDVFTTGLTMNYLSEELKKLSCNKIYSLTLLRTQYKI